MRNRSSDTRSRYMRAIPLILILTLLSALAVGVSLRSRSINQIRPSSELRMVGADDKQSSDSADLIAEEPTQTMIEISLTPVPSVTTAGATLTPEPSATIVPSAAQSIDIPLATPTITVTPTTTQAIILRYSDQRVQNNFVEISCVLGDSNCSFNTIVMGTNNTNTTVQGVTIWTDRSGATITYVNQSGQVVSNQSVFSFERAPGEGVFNTAVTVVPPQQVGSWFAGFYAALRFCTSSTSCQDGAGYGFRVKINVIAAPTLTPTATLTPIPSVTRTVDRQPKDLGCAPAKPTDLQLDINKKILSWTGTGGCGGGAVTYAVRIDSRSESDYNYDYRMNGGCTDFKNQAWSSSAKTSWDVCYTQVGTEEISKYNFNPAEGYDIWINATCAVTPPSGCGKYSDSINVKFAPK